MTDFGSWMHFALEFAYQNGIQRTATSNLKSNTLQN